MAQTRLELIRKQRLKKLQKLRKLGIDPYPAKFDKKHTCGEVGKKLGKRVKTAGRVMAIRGHGKIVFFDLMDSSGRIQVWFQENNLGKEKFEILKCIDTGDFVGVEGKVVKTKAGEISIDVQDFQFLSKALRPLPDKWQGLKDIEERYRKRYLDLLLNSNVKDVFLKRAEIYKAIREFLDEKGFIEVQTPILQTQYGGANASPFVTKINAWNMMMYLRIAYELHLKRLLVGGFEKVYALGSCFRNEGADKTHNPEFAMMEVQMAYRDYDDAMKLTEELWEYVAKKVLKTTKIKFQGKEIELKAPWKRLTIKQALKKFAKIDVDSLSDKELLALAKKHKIECKPVRGELIISLFERLCEDKLIQPVHIIDHPKESCPLSRPHRKDKDLIERVEPFVNGWEVGNCYSELIDPHLQEKLFKEQVKKRREGDEEAHPMDEDYIQALEHALPPNVGMGFGIDRMIMLLTGSESIKDVILFPVMKEKAGNKKSPPIIKDMSRGKIKLNEIYQISEEVSKRFPGIHVGCAIIEGVEVKKEDENLEKFKKKALSKFKDLTTKDISKISTIGAYRGLFRDFGVDWHSRRPSVDALLRRIALKKGLYKVNTLVDAYNLAVIESKIALGAFDKDKFILPIELRFAEENEEIVLLGEKRPTRIRQGELVYTDQVRVITLDMNYRDCDATKISKGTKNILLFADGAPGINITEVKKGLELGCKLITRFCGGKVVRKEII